MKAANVDLWFEGTYEVPRFDLIGRQVEVLRMLHQNLGRRFSISLADLESLGGTSIADVVLRVGAFGGRGQLEVRVDRFAANFRNLTSRNDVAIVCDFMEQTEDALDRALDAKTSQSKSHTLRADFHLKGSEGEQGPLALMTGQPALDLGVLEADSAERGLRLQFGSTLKGWRSEVAVERSMLPGALVFVSYSLTTSQSPQTAKPQDWVSTAERQLLYVLGVHGFELSAENLWNVG